jgi:Predicted periplasmic or secreted lipoprotein
MSQSGRLQRVLLGVALGIGFAATASIAQEKTLPDAQIESNVLKALAGVPELADQTIGTTTVYGTVTLTGTVRDEAARDKAEQVVANTPGVKKVVDEMTIGVPPATETGVAQPPEDVPESTTEATDSNPSVEGAPAPQSTPPTPSGPAPVERSRTAQNPPAPAYPPPYNRQPYRVQQAGQSVVVPAGTLVSVRINQAMDSRNTQPGMAFDGVVMGDVLAGGSVAIPRGATVQGHVVDTHPGGDLRGRGGLALELTEVYLEGHPYPLTTEPWTHQGYDKTGQTVGSAIGLGAVGATIGAIAGGGPGALLGAGIGGAAGITMSAASRQGEATMPSEAIVTFRLSQQAALTTVSQAELDRLGAGLPPPPGPPQQMRRRYYPPAPPPPPYYGPGYYPYPYPYYYPYYR